MDNYWSVHLKKLKIGDENVLRSEIIAILDTGASMIFGPYDDVGYLADALGGWCAEFTSSRSSSVVQVRVTKYMKLIFTCVLYNVLYFVVYFIPVFVYGLSSAIIPARFRHCSVGVSREKRHVVNVLWRWWCEG